MAKINTNASSLIDEYISNLPEFSKEIFELLRNLIHKADNSIIEDWKWNIPVFNKNSMICGIAGFKKHVSLTFFNGAEMSDMHQLFSKYCNAQKTRTIKFTTVEELNQLQLFNYFKEAILLNQIPYKKVVKKAAFKIPELLQTALNKNPFAKDNFEKMAYTYRKEYALHISDTKRESTKLKRLEKVIVNLEQNIKMHE